MAVSEMERVWQREANAAMKRAAQAEDKLRYARGKFKEIARASMAKPERLRELAQQAIDHLGRV